MTYRSGRLIFAAYIFEDNCKLLQDEQTCFLQSNAGILPLAGVSYSFVAICIERLIATIKFINYHKSNEPYIGMALAFITVSFHK